MARLVEIVLEVDDRGSAKVKRFSSTVQNETTKAANAADKNFARMSAKVGASIDRMTKRFARFGLLAGTIIGGLAVRGVLKFGSQFTKTMSGVRAVTGALGRDYGKLEEQARGLGEQTQFSATQAATGMEELGKAGLEVIEIVGSMPDVLNLAGAGELAMAEAASITTDLLKSMGLEVEDLEAAVDSMAKTATSSKTTVSELGLAYQDAAPVARALGVETNELNSTLGVLANRGFTATRAGTALRRVYSVFLGDLEEGEKGLAKFNLNLRDADGKFLGMANAMREFQARGVAAYDIMEAFGLRGGPAMLQIFSEGAVSLDEFAEALENSAGEAARILDERFDNLTGDTKLLLSALQEVGLVIFDKIEPHIRALIQDSTDLSKSWSELLRRTDLWAGIEKAIDLVKFAVIALSVAIATRLLVRLYQAVAATIVWIGTLGGLGATLHIVSMELGLFATAGIAAQVAIGGIVLAVGGVTYYLTRMIMELTGADTAVTDFFHSIGQSARALVGARTDYDDAIDGFERAVDYMGRIRDRIEKDKIKLDIDDEKALKKAELLVRQMNATTSRTEKIRLFQDADPTVQALLTARGRTQELHAEMRKLEKGGEKAWSELTTGAKTFTEAVRQAGGKTTITAEEAEAAVKAAQAAAAAADKLKKDTKALEKELSGAGLATTAMAEALLGDFKTAMETAGQLGLDDAAVYRAFKDDLHDMIEAALKAGQDVPAELVDIYNAARALEDVEIDLGKMLLGANIEDIQTQFEALDLKPPKGISNLEERLEDLVKLAGDLEDALDESDTEIELEGKIAIEQVRAEIARVVAQLGGTTDAIEIPVRFVPTGVEEWNLDPERIGDALIPQTEIDERINRVGEKFQELSQIFAAGEISGPVFDLRLDDLREDLGEVANLLDEADLPAIADILPGFNVEDWSERWGKIAEADKEAMMALLEARAEMTDEWSDARLELEIVQLEDALTEKLNLTETSEDARKALITATDKEIQALKKKYRKEDLKDEKELAKQKRALILGGLSMGVGAIEEIFGKSKATAIATAIINTAVGVTKAYELPFPLSLIISSLIMAAGMVQISKIRSAAPGAAEGGLISGRHMIEVGERGQEIITPLEGWAAAKARAALGIPSQADIARAVSAAIKPFETGLSPAGGARTTQPAAPALIHPPPAPAESAPIYLSMPIHIHGDNWSDSGISDDLRRTIYDSLQEAIGEGRELALPGGLQF